jgi:hypothetical protein
MTVKVHLITQAVSIDYENVKNAYTKGSMYCIYTQTGDVHKFPIANIFRVIESYK